MRLSDAALLLRQPLRHPARWALCFAMWRVLQQRRLPAVTAFCVAGVDANAACVSCTRVARAGDRNA